MHHIAVSILVLMDFALKLYKNICYLLQYTVSILVLMDFALKLGKATNKMCFVYDYVSILVLMDFALKQVFFEYSPNFPSCFNPCFDGFCS